ncbi:MAG: restriction endonuclease [Limnothrix sp. BL-A-16]
MLTLTLDALKLEAKNFAILESQHSDQDLYGVDNGKSVGTYIEHKFQDYLKNKSYKFNTGNSALGIDLPELEVDIKVTSIRQPQSSCPFRSARQKVYGLGYSILLFVYQKYDDHQLQSSTLKIHRSLFINSEYTADYQLTRSLRSILDNDGNVDDIMAHLIDRHLPVDEIGALLLAEEIYRNPPKQGFLTISNALQWRLQYARAIQIAEEETGLECLYKND